MLSFELQTNVQNDLIRCNQQTKV